METIIKNVRYLSDLISPEQLKKLNYGAMLHGRYSRITFKVISAYEPKKELTIEVRQGKSPAENYIGAKDLVSHTRDLFERFLPIGWTPLVNAVPYDPPASEIVDSKWIQTQMERMHIKATQVSKETGMAKYEISNWISGRKELSQIGKSMLYYYFAAKELEREKVLK